jgi:hypothetical protein
MGPQIDLLESLAAKEAGIKQVSDHNETWMERALEMVARSNLTGPFEAWRARLLSQGIETPNHANAWGALCRTAQRRGLIERTGRHVRMADVRSHGRETPEYRSVETVNQYGLSRWRE